MFSQGGGFWDFWRVDVFDCVDGVCLWVVLNIWEADVLDSAALHRGYGATGTTGDVIFVLG